ncbi:DUF1573 domain-containing protein [Capnocytophaga cynodegmi]|uniref:DUF1573 domain-containing protein n=1 Tax=Capnocytophaga cynodegmi TaxID=28189 RepID=A0A0B7HFZ1_9FLAO|nr:DUF1573 domain-containing protein [Capnocytophaga cynodegmi]CEN36787.1 hypothetical protein CCYN2B_330027 [Capnocytophaga cynodegmi]
MRYYIFILVICVFSVYFSCNAKRDKKEVVQVEKNIPLNDIQKMSKTRGNLKISKSRIDIGEIKKGKNITHKFILKNIGKENVEITDYRTSCNCTGIDISQKTISPSDSVTVTIIVDTQDKGLGKHNIYTTLATNGQRKYYNLELYFALVN